MSLEFLHVYERLYFSTTTTTTKNIHFIAIINNNDYDNSLYLDRSCSAMNVIITCRSCRKDSRNALLHT